MPGKPLRPDPRPGGRSPAPGGRARPSGTCRATPSRPPCLPPSPQGFDECLDLADGEGRDVLPEAPCLVGVVLPYLGDALQKTRDAEPIVLDQVGHPADRVG